MTQPLRIGILGAARIAGRAVIEPAKALGHELVAVAARDLGRAQAYAGEHGIARAYGSYSELLADPDVEVVYNPSPNSEHVKWTLAALRAGKHVLSEKPFGSNAAEAKLVAAEPNPAGLVIFEGFHHRYHPAHLRLLDLVGSGAIGEVTRLEVNMKFDCDDLADIRWSWPLSGGSLMDLGCYHLHVARNVAEALGGELRPLAVRATRLEGTDPRVDATAVVEATLPNGAPAVLESSLEGPADFTVRVTGTRGTILQADFINITDDDRLILTVDGVDTIEHHGKVSTYTHQLRAVAAAIREGAGVPTGLANAIANMELVDECYRLAGLPLRQSTLG
ncbi:MAG: Gfo/Idh/MocA family oxidoreductase [Propionibacteriaceae bacterium]|nr:Gfo/Idh/MocA family oxidoreductase [Propionibacteriaceae bacterium]